MANAWYACGLKTCMEGDVRWDTDTIKCVAVDTAGYTANLQTDDFLADIGASYRIGTATIASIAVTVTGASAIKIDGNDITFAAITGASVEAIVVYKDTGDAATSPLLLYIDTASNLPFTPAGADQDVAWAAGGIATIGT